MVRDQSRERTDLHRRLCLLTEEALTVLVWTVTELPLLRDNTRTALRREVLHRIALGGQSFSSAMSAATQARLVVIEEDRSRTHRAPASDQELDALEQGTLFPPALVEECLSQIATGSPGDTYSLAADAWVEVDPLFWHLKREDLEAVREAKMKALFGPMKDSPRPDPVPVPLAPPAPGPVAPMFRPARQQLLFSAAFMLRVVRPLLQDAVAAAVHSGPERTQYLHAQVVVVPKSESSPASASSSTAPTLVARVFETKGRDLHFPPVPPHERTTEAVVAHVLHALTLALHEALREDCTAADREGLLELLLRRPDGANAATSYDNAVTILEALCFLEVVSRERAHVLAEFEQLAGLECGASRPPNALEHRITCTCGGARSSPRMSSLPRPLHQAPRLLPQALLPFRPPHKCARTGPLPRNAWPWSACARHNRVLPTSWMRTPRKKKKMEKKKRTRRATRTVGTKCLEVAGAIARRMRPCAMLETTAARRRQRAVRSPARLWRRTRPWTIPSPQTTRRLLPRAPSHSPSRPHRTSFCAPCVAKARRRPPTARSSFWDSRRHPPCWPARSRASSGTHWNVDADAVRMIGPKCVPQGWLPTVQMSAEDAGAGSLANAAAGAASAATHAPAHAVGASGAGAAGTASFVDDDWGLVSTSAALSVINAEPAVSGIVADFEDDDDDNVDFDFGDEDAFEDMEEVEGFDDDDEEEEGEGEPADDENDGGGQDTDMSGDDDGGFFFGEIEDADVSPGGGATSGFRALRDTPRRSCAHLHTRFCTHALHSDCLEGFVKSVHDKQRAHSPWVADQDPARFGLNIDMNEYQCPLCKGPWNVGVPFVSKSRSGVAELPRIALPGQDDSAAALSKIVAWARGGAKLGHNGAGSLRTEEAKVDILYTAAVRHLRDVALHDQLRSQYRRGTTRTLTTSWAYPP